MPRPRCDSNGLTPQDNSLARRWFQRLAGPEALVLTALLLGPWLALFQLLVVFIMSAYLAHARSRLPIPTASCPTMRCALALPIWLTAVPLGCFSA